MSITRGLYIIVGARRAAGLNISPTADLIGFSHTTKKPQKKSPESGSCKEENGLVRAEVRGHDEGTGKRSERQQEMK